MHIGQFFRLGTWTVKRENVPKFIEAWQSSAAWITGNLGGDGEGVLLQDSDHPGKFVSFASSSNPEEAQEVMSRPEFQELWSSVMELCEDVQPHRMHVVAYSDPQPDG